MKNSYKIMVRNMKGRASGRPRHRWEEDDDIRMDLREIR
jgi:hypothetical protein